MPWETLTLSVVLYILVPVVVAQIWRKRFIARRNPLALAALLARLHPVALVALLVTLVLLFGFQGRQILDQPLVIAMLAVPILIQVYFNSALAYWLNRQLGVAHNVACPSALIGAIEFLRACRRGGHQPLRLPVRRRAGDRRGRADRGSGDAVGGEARAPYQGLV